MDPVTWLTLIISIFIIFINGSVCYLFVSQAALKIKASNNLLHSLSVADFLSGLTIIIHILMIQGVINTEPLAVRLAADFFTTFTTTTVIVHLVVITVDRAISLFQALHYVNLVTKSFIKRVIVCIWLFPLLTTLVQLAYLYPLFQGEGNISMKDEDHIIKCEMWYSILIFIIYMATPFLSMGILFMAMFREITKLLRRTPSANASNRQQKRVLCIFGCMYICFVILALPYFALRLYIDIQAALDNEININETVYETLYVFKTLTSLCNPLLYTLLNREIRSIGRLWFSRRRQCFRKTLENISTAPMLLRSRGSADSGIHTTEIMMDQSVGDIS
ncbi:histamine H2 receptor-like [Clytia hemisphaerica]|uniref:G-protein coupled receptors family 1 profile domain-containing protein n=1 Tax=Clytia hemisphaerica TaxID=252671 RepID=A0A7M5TV81_9CNID|eukprot:TCONS_00057245-protein